MDRFIFKIDKSLKQEIESKAKKEERSMSSLIRLALKKYLSGKNAEK